MCVIYIYIYIYTRKEYASPAIVALDLGDDFINIQVHMNKYISKYIYLYIMYVYVYKCVEWPSRASEALRLVGSLKYRSLLQIIVSFIGLFCKRDL